MNSRLTAAPLTLHKFISGGAPKKKADGLGKDLSAIFDDLALTNEDVKKMSDAVFLIPNLIVKGTVHGFAAPANGGKTTIFTHVCEELVKCVEHVFYINVDGSPGDLKRHHEHAEKYGYRVISPDAKDGKSVDDALARIEALAASSYELDEVVIILDTLKKFTDVMSKPRAKDFYAMLRKLSVKGATICLMSHTNKYKDDEGNYMFEGTVDYRNDIDHLIYLTPQVDELADGAKRVTVTTRPDKIRANFKPRTFIINIDSDGNREVVDSDRVIPVLPPEIRETLKLISDGIESGNNVQSHLIKYVTDRSSLSKAKVMRVLEAHTGEGKEFDSRPGDKNSKLYYKANDPAVLGFEVTDRIWSL